jgi:hypothetical protein
MKEFEPIGWTSIYEFFSNNKQLNSKDENETIK